MKAYQELKTEQGILRGFLEQPDTTEKVPLVIMYHGFTGHKAENRFLFVQFARYLCEQQIASLRFDFLGSGESDQDFSYMTFSKEVNEAHAILDYAKTLPFVSKIIVMGISMGGAVATQVAKDRPYDFDKLILWAPAGNMNDIIAGNKNNVPTLDNGNYEFSGLELSQAFAEDIVKQDLYTDVEQFDKPVALFHGLKDMAVDVKISEKYQSIYPKSTLHTYENADHTFTNVLVRRQLFKDNVAFILE